LLVAKLRRAPGGVAGLAPARAAPCALPGPRLLSLPAGLVAVALLALGLLVLAHRAREAEVRSVHALAAVDFDQKSLGAALQVAAASQPDLLLVIGSSELDFGGSFQASRLFEHYPTGFTTFMVGRSGAADLIYLQDVAAIGPALDGKRVVISLTPSVFFEYMTGHDSYAGSFSRLHANELAFSSDLSYPLKQEAARRMLAYPESLERDPLLRFALEQLADGSPASHLRYAAVLPLGKLQTLVLRLQDHWATLQYLWEKPRQATTEVEHRPAALNWPALVDEAARLERRKSRNNSFGFDSFYWDKHSADLLPLEKSETDASFLKVLRESQEWTDLRLLLRALRELHAQPLIVSLPIPGLFYDYMGVSAAARATYYRELESVGKRHGVPVVDFADHDQDTLFVVDRWSHPSGLGWVYYDQALDDFYHGRLTPASRKR